MYVSCEYRGKSIYKNQLDLCSAEDETSDKSFVCPIERGRKRFVKQMKIPNYLPKVCISLNFINNFIFLFLTKLNNFIFLFLMKLNN